MYAAPSAHSIAATAADQSVPMRVFQNAASAAIAAWAGPENREYADGIVIETVPIASQVLACQ
jgi:hypothetical protein